MPAQIRIVAYYTLIEAMRNRLVWLTLLILLSGFGFSYLLGSVSLIESGQIQSGFLAAFYRLAAVFILSSFTMTSALRDAQEKGLEFVFAMPVSRTTYFLGKLGGSAQIAAILAVLFSMPLFFHNQSSPVFVWAISLFLELLLMASISLFFSLALSGMLQAATAVLAFYLLARSIDAMKLILHGPLVAHTFYQKLMGFLVSGLSFFLPKLDSYTQTAWLLYPNAAWGELLHLVLQTLVYVALISSASLFDLYRREI